jgi:hypothetical protein
VSSVGGVELRAVDAEQQNKAATWRLCGDLYLAIRQLDQVLLAFRRRRTQKKRTRKFREPYVTSGTTKDVNLVFVLLLVRAVGFLAHFSD